MNLSRPSAYISFDSFPKWYHLLSLLLSTHIIWIQLVSVNKTTIYEDQRWCASFCSCFKRHNLFVLHILLAYGVRRYACLYGGWCAALLGWATATPASLPATRRNRKCTAFCKEISHHISTCTAGIHMDYMAQICAPVCVCVCVYLARAVCTQWENEQTFAFFGNPIHHLVYLDYITVYYLPSAITIFLHYTVTAPHQNE